MMDNERTATILIGDEEYTLLLTTKATSCLLYTSDAADD